MPLMRKLNYFFGSLLVIAVIIVSCSKDNEQDLNSNPGGGNPGGGGSTSCDTVNMQYAASIKPILQNNCYACHGNGLSNGGVTLDTYAGVKAVADNGKLVGVINHAAGFKQMPQGGAKLSQCNIDKIEAWIKRGAPNN